MNAPWTTHTTLRRRWPDGTEFVIRPATPGQPRLLTAIGGFQLSLIHSSGLRAHSHHPTVAAAQAHAEEFMAGLSGDKSAEGTTR